MNAPVVTIRSTVSPYSVLSSLTFSQSLNGQTLPVKEGETSDEVTFRVYNNFGLASTIATMNYVHIAVYDGASAGSHTCLKTPVSQSWLRLQQTGYGEGASTPGNVSKWNGASLALGGCPAGANTYAPEKGSDGTSDLVIRAGSSNNGLGFLEYTAVVDVPAGAAMNNYTFAITVEYEWNT